ncbi:hypothetical protein SteCoe_16665 [Stentor coeruleus]|uniref:Seipin n=1 Tax=Stentor coeruleus TaxID=5963 RepID=A0A1R2C0S7_9CILI|nr:hypothetical protein SteCoe_16665 [Stentor coeruleus]
MPVPYQHSIISMYKSQDSLIGLTEQEITLQNENYLISVNLQVPEDEINTSIGNFEIELTFRYKNGQIKKLKNLGILKYYSYYTKIIKNLVKLPFVLLGIYDESQVVTVKFYHSLLHAEEIEKVFIKIVPQELRIYSMSIDFEVRLEGIRNFMYAHGYYSFFIGAGGIFCMLCGFFIMMTALNYEWIWKNQEIKENEIKDTRVKEDNETCASSEDACPCPQEIEFQFASIIKQMPEKPWYKF